MSLESIEWVPFKEAENFKQIETSTYEEYSLYYQFALFCDDKFRNIAYTLGTTLTKLKPLIIAENPAFFKTNTNCQIEKATSSLYVPDISKIPEKPSFQKWILFKDWDGIPIIESSYDKRLILSQDDFMIFLDDKLRKIAYLQKTTLANLRPVIVAENKTLFEYLEKISFFNLPFQLNPVKEYLYVPNTEAYPNPDSEWIDISPQINNEA